MYLIQAILDNELQHVISNVPSVVGFLTTGDQPTPLRPDEMNRILGKVDEAREMGEQPEIPFKVGDAIKVVDGPFNNFTGFVEEVYPDKMKVKVMVSIFGRKTPLELDYLAGGTRRVEESAGSGALFPEVPIGVEPRNIAGILRGYFKT